MKQIYSIINNKENKSKTEQIGEELARYITVLPICVSLRTTYTIIHNFTIFNLILLKLSLICFAFIKTNLISDWTSPLTITDMDILGNVSVILKEKKVRWRGSGFTPVFQSLVLMMIENTFVCNSIKQ